MSKIVEASMTHCAGSGQALFYTVVGEELFPLSAHGQCSECKEWFCEEFLFFQGVRTRSDIPIEWIGRMCLDCADKI